MFVLSSLVAVLTEGLPAAFLYFCLLGVQGAPVAGACSSGVMGFLCFFFFPKVLDSSLILRKIFFLKKETFHAFG